MIVKKSLLEWAIGRVGQVRKNLPLNLTLDKDVLNPLSIPRVSSPNCIIRTEPAAVESAVVSVSQGRTCKLVQESASHYYRYVDFFFLSFFVSMVFNYICTTYIKNK